MPALEIVTTCKIYFNHGNALVRYFEGKFNTSNKMAEAFILTRRSLLKRKN